MVSAIFFSNFLSNNLYQPAVKTGTTIAVITTEVATSAVAEAAIGWNSGTIWAMMIGFVTAAPAVEAAASPAHG